MMRRREPLAALVAILALHAAACRRDAAATEPLTIFHAGSLSIPFRELSVLFQQRHPGVRILAEAAGSRDSARKVSDLHRSCDVLGSADAGVIEELLMPEHAEFNIDFATGELVIAYTDRSRLAEKLTAGAWPDVLLHPQVTFGRSDPQRDPCGYRTVFLFQLAERHYRRPGLATALEQKGGRRYIRPKETDLLALLEAGEIDYLFIYRSVAAQHRLKMLLLPEEVNLGAPSRAALYASARTTVTGRRPGELALLRGSPIVYGVTIPRSSRNPTLAAAYLSLLLSPKGQEVMRRNGQPPLQPPRARGRLPGGLERCCGSSR